MNKLVLQTVIDRDRYVLETLLIKGLITEKDIINLMNQDDNYGISFLDKELSYKEKYLKSLFRKPYLLCDQNVSDNVKKLLPMFLDRMFNLELNELKHHLEDNDYTKVEYNEILSILIYKMYESSNDGISIRETGYAVGIKDNVLKAWFLNKSCYNIFESSDERVVVSLII